ncbi:histone PARylation factor 1 isoform 2-T2 [Mantella aurantiaca]
MTSRQAGANSDTVKEDVKKRRSDQSDVPASLRQEVECSYKLTMPEDFYTFWTFCTEIDPKRPNDVLKDSLGLQLVGPYDILSGKYTSLKKKSDVYYNLHWRFFYDPPEFQTIIVGDCRTQFHMGYYRDSPEEMPVFVGTNEASKGCLINLAGDNVFSAVKLFATKRLKEISDRKTVAAVKDLIEKLEAAAKKLDYSLEQKSTSIKRRDKKVVTKSFHGAGLMVPVDKNDVGYRELPETDGNLKKICKAIVEAPTDDVRVKNFAPIQEMVTYVQFANDECDYGMGYELGIDLFCYGSHYFHKLAGQLLPMAYKLLKRDLFAEIIECHLANRRKENIKPLDA